MKSEVIGKDVGKFAGGGGDVDVSSGIDANWALVGRVGKVDADTSGEEAELSGKGYSKRVEVVAKGVPTIWEDGECRAMSERLRAGIVRGVRGLLLGAMSRALNCGARC